MLESETPQITPEAEREVDEMRDSLGCFHAGEWAVDPSTGEPVWRCPIHRLVVVAA